MSPLAGQRVLVPRPPHQSAALADALAARGAVAVPVPLIRVVPPEDPAPLRDRAARLEGYDWVVLTSRNAVDALFAARPDAAAPWPSGVRVAVVGPATARALEARGVRPDLVPGEAVGDALAAPLVASGTPGEPLRVLFPRAEVAREVLPEALRAAGVDLDLVVAYRTVGPDEPARERLVALFPRADPPGVDAVLLTSSSTIERLVDVLGAVRAAARLAPVVVASIGPRTTETAEALGVRVDVTAATHTTDGLLDALEEHLRTDRSHQP